MTRRRWEELKKTDDSSFVFCGFLVISTKIIQRMLRGMYGKSCQLQIQCLHHQKIGWGSQRTQAEDEPWSCHAANGSFPSNFCKILWVGGNKHEMEPYCLGTGALHLNFLLLCLKYNSQPWGEGSSPLCFQQGTPVGRQRAAFCQRPGFTCAHRLKTLEMPLQHLKTQALHLIRVEGTAFLGCGCSVHAQPGHWEDTQEYVCRRNKEHTA